MELQVVGKNVEITQATQDYVRKKIDKLVRYLPKTDEAKVEIAKEKTKSPKHRFTVQITIRSKGILLRGEENGANVNIAVDAVTEVIARQIERYKGKSYRKGRGVSASRQILAPEGVAVDGEADVLPKVVKVKRFSVKSMSLDEATEQMELLSHDFFLFVNDDSGALNLVYRRKNGNYGLIEPMLA